MKKLFAILMVALLATSVSSFAQTSTWTSPTVEGEFTANVVCVPSLLPTAAQSVPLGNYFVNTLTYVTIPGTPTLAWGLTGPNDAFASYSASITGNLKDPITGAMIKGILRAEGLVDEIIDPANYGDPLAITESYGPMSGADLNTLASVSPGNGFGCTNSWDFSFEATDILSGIAGLPVFTFTAQVTVTI